MRIPYIAALLVVSALLFAGCTTTEQSADTDPEVVAPTSAPSTPSSSSSPSPSATAPASLQFSLDAVTYTDESGDRVLPYSDAAPILELLAELSGSTTEPQPVEGPYGGEWPGLSAYEWNELGLTVFEQGIGDVTVRSASFSGVTMSTDLGVSVGSTRESVDALADGDGYDIDGDGINDALFFQHREVPGTTSLVDGGVGSIFMVAELDGDVVVELVVPGNDYSDI
ncbi:hypothetical protein OVN20_06645 [Microcella daejeonensis]|uniref:hypothetical protein n=1 Tax=Microcella daejeonensis TaxID=2994971 RepID=UPI00227089A0|nr:hypothetical protein [Microcella daejeonensis]WAB85218.1 hypothetical protein OVN20_06645 [Microcella daejeonensis]